MKHQQLQREVSTTTKMQAGETAVQYFRKQDHLADKMVVWHRMSFSLLRILEVLSYGLLKDDDGTVAGIGREQWSGQQ